MNQQNKELALTFLTDLLRRKETQNLVEDYKTAFYKTLLEGTPLRTRPTVEKFFFNSKLSPLKALWLLKLAFEKQKLVVPEQTRAFLQSLVQIIEFGKTSRQREAFSLFDRDKYLHKKFEQIVTKAKQNQSSKLKEFCKRFTTHHKYSHAVNLLFVVEKTYQRNLNSHFSFFKARTLRDFHALQKAAHFFVESLKNKSFNKKGRIFNLLKLHSQKRSQQQAGLQRLCLFHEMHQKKRKKRAFNDIFRHSVAQNNSIVETEAKVFLSFKTLERVVSTGQLKSKVQALRAFQESLQEIRKQKKNALKQLVRKQLLKNKKVYSIFQKLLSKNQVNKALFLNKLENKLSNNFKKSAFLEIRKCQSQQDLKLFKNYLQKWKESNIQIRELNRKNYQTKKNQFLKSLGNNVANLEHSFNVIKKRNLRAAFNNVIQNIKREDDNQDQNKVIQDTLTLANLVNYLNKKRKMDKFLALYKWRENAKKEGTFRYAKSKNDLGQSEIVFEYLPDYNYGQLDVDVFRQQKQKVFLTMLEYIFLKRKAAGMRAIVLEANRIKAKEILKIFALIIREMKLKREMYFWRRLNTNLKESRVEERKEKLQSFRTEIRVVRNIKIKS